MAAGGPKSLALAARHADRVTYCLGPNPAMISLTPQQLDKAVADAGRPAGSVKLVSNTWFYLLRPGATWEDAVGNGFGSGPISSCTVSAADEPARQRARRRHRQVGQPGRYGRPGHPRVPLPADHACSSANAAHQVTGAPSGVHVVKEAAEARPSPLPRNLPPSPGQGSLTRRQTSGRAFRGLHSNFRFWLPSVSRGAISRPG